MSGALKEVRNRIKSVQSTQQITKAMKMVSAAKLRRAQDAITQMRPYAKKLQQMLSNIVSSSEGDVSMAFSFSNEPSKNGYQLHGKIKREGIIIEGDVLLPDGNWGSWAAIRKQKNKEKSVDDKKDESLIATTPKSWSPNLAFGRTKEIADQPLVFKNITLWTNEAEGVINNASLVCFAGKIILISKGEVIIPPNAIIIDGKGMHLTTGIIDEHSHIAISRGVNEGGQTVSAEVSIADVVNPDDINIYRQLAGGVTAAQLLHGSANTIGGQSALVKLKWGFSPDEMLIPNAPKFIKCALGENVKHSNGTNPDQVSS